MKIIKRFTAIKLDTSTTDNSVNVELSYGSIKGPYYSREYPKEEFDTEEEAIEYAYKTDKWCTWLILPIINFDNF